MIIKVIRNSQEVLFRTNAPTNKVIEHRNSFEFIQEDLIECLKSEGYYVEVLSPSLILNYDEK